MKSFDKKSVLVMAALLIIAGGSSCVYGQQYTVSGTITASGTPVQDALVTFVDNSNASLTYSALTNSTGTFNLGSITAIEAKSQLHRTFQLAQNYPNPFSSGTAISYNLEKNSDVKVTIYDVLGRVVRDYTMGYQGTGVHGIIWNGRNNLGEKVTPGVYFYRLQANGKAIVKKMVYGIGSSNGNVSLTGTLPSQAFKSGSQEEVAVQGENFTVNITNTDSTSPLMVPTSFSSITVMSDTTFGFSLVKLNPATVNSDSLMQVIEGFGCANVLIFYPAGMTTAELNTAFDTTAGDIGLTIMRVSIPSDSTQFSQDVPSVKLADALGVKVIATPWTPPAWMKTNDNTSGGSLDTNDYGAFASYLKSFGDTMSTNGAPVYAISVQNEPNFKASYQSCLWNGTQFLNFMKNNAPEVGYPVFMPETDDFSHALSDSTLNDSVAAAHVAFIGGHIYGDVAANGTVSSSVQYPLALQKGKQLWMTEYLIDTPNPPPISSIDTGWTGAMASAKCISDVMNFNMSAFVWWQANRYYSLIGDGSYGTVNGQVTKKGYVTSQFARFIRPGYHRIYTSYSPQQNVYLTAYEGNGETVLVILNMNSNPTLQPITLMNSNVTTFTPYVTTDYQNCQQQSSVTVSNGKFTATLAPSSITTYVSN